MDKHGLAHLAAKRALANGRIEKKTACERCGTRESRLVGHHMDYNKPLELVWLCDGCHHHWHRVNRPIELGDVSPPEYESELGFTDYFMPVLEAGINIRLAARMLGVSRPAIYRWARDPCPQKWQLVLFQYLIDHAEYRRSYVR
jgi:hypothetical protein